MGLKTTRGKKLNDEGTPAPTEEIKKPKIQAVAVKRNVDVLQPITENTPLVTKQAEKEGVSVDGKTDVHDNQQYCVAEIRKTKGSPGDIFDKAVKTYQDGFHFKMSKVALNGKSKPEYVSAPCKFVVDLT